MEWRILETSKNPVCFPICAVDREASEKEREKVAPTFKDNDFLNDGVKICIGEEAKAKLVETLAADVAFLTKQSIMDYSLLLGESKLQDKYTHFSKMGTQATKY